VYHANVRQQRDASLYSEGGGAIPNALIHASGTGLSGRSAIWPSGILAGCRARCCFLNGHTLFDPRREHSSVPSAKSRSRRAQGLSRRAAATRTLDRPKNGGTIPADLTAASKPPIIALTKPRKRDPRRCLTTSIDNLESRTCFVYDSAGKNLIGHEHIPRSARWHAAYLKVAANEDRRSIAAHSKSDTAKAWRAPRRLSPMSGFRRLRLRCDLQMIVRTSRMPGSRWPRFRRTHQGSQR
jgi:hypothetical protein